MFLFKDEFLVYNYLVFLQKVESIGPLFIIFGWISFRSLIQNTPFFSCVSKFKSYIRIVNMLAIMTVNCDSIKLSWFAHIIMHGACIFE